VRTADQVYGICHFTNDDPDFLCGERLCSLKDRLPQGVKIQVGTRCHSSSQNHDLWIKQANEVSYRKSEKPTGTIENVQCQRVTLAGGSRNIVRRNFRGV
jgi:hypothetical protein